MSIFFDLLSAINNPNQQGNVSQLSSVMNSLQSMTNNRGIQPSQMQSMMSLVGNLIRPELKQQRATMGEAKFENLIGQAVASGLGTSTFQSLVSPKLMQQISQTVAQKTGISPNVVQTAIPAIVSTLFGLLNMGAPKEGTRGTNSLLNSFLDSDNDGDTDLGDVLKFASRFLSPSVA